MLPWLLDAAPVHPNQQIGEVKSHISTDVGQPKAIPTSLAEGVTALSMSGWPRLQPASGREQYI